MMAESSGLPDVPAPLLPKSIGASFSTRGELRKYSVLAAMELAQRQVDGDGLCQAELELAAAECTEALAMIIDL